MKRLLLLGTVTLLPSTAVAQQSPIKCPGENTVEMRFCASKSWEQSTARLRRKVPASLLQQWHEATRAVCAAAYAPYKDGSIYPQLLVGCEDNLNQTLLREFVPMDAR